VASVPGFERVPLTNLPICKDSIVAHRAVRGITVANRIGTVFVLSDYVTSMDDKECLRCKHVDVGSAYYLS
jgi:hypothetical protein